MRLKIKGYWEKLTLKRLFEEGIEKK